MCVGDLSNAVGSAQIHAGLSKHAALSRDGLSLLLLPTGVWDHRSQTPMPGTCSGGHALRDGPSLLLGTVAREVCGSVELVEIFQMREVPRSFRPVCRSRCGAGGADRGPGAERFVRDFGPLPLCAALLVQANINHISDRDLGYVLD